MKYSVVKISVVGLKKECPFYKFGDTMIIRQQCFSPHHATPSEFCMHSLYDLYPIYMELRKAPPGTKQRKSCPDEGIIEFELERLPDEDGTGWARPEEQEKKPAKTITP